MNETETDLVESNPENKLTTAKHYDPVVKAKAYELFLTTSMDLTDLAVSLNVPVHVIGAWSKTGGWLKRKGEIETELFNSAEDKYKQFIIKHKVATVTRHLQMCETIEGLVQTMADKMKNNPDTVTAVSLEKLTKALSNATAVSARAVGITDKIIGSVQDIKQQGNQGLPPLIVFNAGPQPIEKGVKYEDGETYDGNCVEHKE